MENINKYDLFIAYHGTENPDGSVDKAKKIYNWLTGKGVKCFFHPVTNKNTGNFGDTSEDAKCSKLFLFVANSYVPCKCNGTLDSEEVNGEIRGYFSRTNTDDYQKSGRVYAYGGLDAQGAGALHTRFASIAHFEENGGEVDAFHRVLEWIENCLKNDKIKDERLLDKEEKPVADTHDEITEVIFNYDSKRGMMINPEDGSRNISFRADTLEQFLGDLYANIAKYADEETANKVFYDAGHERGSSFAERANGLWADGSDIETLQNNINKWCKFDSRVGWGKFSAEISYDEEKDEVKGRLTIIEPIMVDRKNKRKTCAFLRGYCTGVLEYLLGTGDVSLVCKNYPNCIKGRFGVGNKCEFDIIINV